jgi:hypothetical protein
MFDLPLLLLHASRTEMTNITVIAENNRETRFIHTLLNADIKWPSSVDASGSPVCVKERLISDWF